MGFTSTCMLRRCLYNSCLCIARHVIVALKVDGLLAAIVAALICAAAVADPPTGAAPPPLHACTALLSACNAPFPPQTLLTLVSLVATLQHVRPATVLTHLLSLATHHLHAAAAPAVAADTFPAALLAIERLMTPLATCARRRALTRREFTLYSRATSPLLSECARTFELLHWLRTSSTALSRQPDCVLRLVGLVGLATRFDADSGGVWDLVRPHFAAAVRRGMLEHAAALDTVRSPYAAVDSLIWALAALLEDTQAEVSMARSLPEPYVAMAAHARYRVVAAGVERAWGGAVAEGAPVLMYDERLQQLEGLFRDVHELFVRLDLSQQHSRRSITQSAQPGSVLYLPGSVRRPCTPCCSLFNGRHEYTLVLCVDSRHMKRAQICTPWLVVSLPCVAPVTCRRACRALRCLTSTRCSRRKSSPGSTRSGPTSSGARSAPLPPTTHRRTAPTALRGGCSAASAATRALSLRSSRCRTSAATVFALTLLCGLALHSQAQSAATITLCAGVGFADKLCCASVRLGARERSSAKVCIYEPSALSQSDRPQGVRAKCAPPHPHINAPFLTQVLSHNLPHLLERAVATRPPRLAAANAEAVIAAVGSMLRRYCGLLEESALADLVPGAEAGRAAGTLAADTAALLLGCPRGGLARANMPAQSDADHVTMGCLAPGKAPVAQVCSSQRSRPFLSA